MEFSVVSVCFVIIMAWLVFAVIGGIVRGVKFLVNRLNKRPFMITYYNDDKPTYFWYNHNLKKYVVDETFDCSKAGPEVFHSIY